LIGPYVYLFRAACFENEVAKKWELGVAVKLSNVECQANAIF